MCGSGARHASALNHSSSSSAVSSLDASGSNSTCHTILQLMQVMKPASLTQQASSNHRSRPTAWTGDCQVAAPNFSSSTAIREHITCCESPCVVLLSSFAVLFVSWAGHLSKDTRMPGLSNPICHGKTASPAGSIYNNRPYTTAPPGTEWYTLYLPGSAPVARCHLVHWRAVEHNFERYVCVGNLACR